jgi:hypothetical protein
MAPSLEALGERALPAATATAGALGPYIAPATIAPRVSQPSAEQNVHNAISNYLAAVLGEQQLRPIQQRVAAQETSTRAPITQRILSKPFVRALFANRDTYTLLNSNAMSQLIGVTVVSDSLETQSTVRYLLSGSSDLLSIGSETALVQIPANGSVAGFIATVPTSSVRARSDGLYTVDVPRDQIPTNAPAPITINEVTGSLQTTYLQTGPILANALQTGRHTGTPNAPRTVPGLRLSSLLATNQAFPSGSSQHRLVRLMRVAVARKVFTPTAAQRERINATLADFLSEVDALKQSGTFTPPQPPVAPTPIKGPLKNTLAVTVAAIRDLDSVPVSISGLPLGQVVDSEGVARTINLRGRIDVGYVIDSNGNYGLIFTARGPLLEDPPGLQSADTIGGDIRIEVSNATSLERLDGLRDEEGLTLGGALESTISTSNANGVSRWGVSVGYGSGFEFGTAVAYTRVVPLGNINALLPNYPKRLG